MQKEGFKLHTQRIGFLINSTKLTVLTKM